MEETKKLTPGRWMGIVAFVHVLASITIAQFIVILNLNMDIESWYKLCALSFGVFSVVWTAVFGNGIVKKLKKDSDISPI